jgi:MFS transporter, ACS family, solute carrier family 17 (sodium-dependent inorganic phosphate cotransporter), other
MTISLGLNGASTLTSGANAQDLSPNYAGSVFGIANFFATMSGFLSPLLVSFITQNQVRGIILQILMSF